MVLDPKFANARIKRALHDKEHPYVMITRSLLQSKDISLEAKGLLVFLLAQRSDWDIALSKLAKYVGTGRDRVQRIINELIEKGYCKRIDCRDAKGKFMYFYYEVYEEPILIEKNDPEPENQVVAHNACEPFPENPLMAQPVMGFRTAYINNEEYINNELKEEIINTNAAASPPCVRFGSFVKLQKEDYEKFCADKTKSVIDDLIEEINDYCASSRPKGYSCYAATIRSWLRRRKNSPKASSPFAVDRRTKNIDGSPVTSPVDGRF